MAHVRSLLFSMLVGFHNAWDQDDRSLEELGIRFRFEHREFAEHPLARPERCFFWGQSSLLN